MRTVAWPARMSHLMGTSWGLVGLQKYGPKEVSSRRFGTSFKVKTHCWPSLLVISLYGQNGANILSFTFKYFTATKCAFRGIRFQSATVSLRQWNTFPALFTHPLFKFASTRCVWFTHLVTWFVNLTSKPNGSLIFPTGDTLVLPERCRSSIFNYRRWILVKIPIGCHTSGQVKYFIFFIHN